MEEKRFGTRSEVEVDAFISEFGDNPSTLRSIETMRRIFEDFCGERKLAYDPKIITDGEIDALLSDFIVNVRRKDGTHYMENVIKLIFNSVASNIITKDVKMHQSRQINIFADSSFEKCHKAQNAKRKELQ